MTNSLICPNCQSVVGKYLDIIYEVHYKIYRKQMLDNADTLRLMLVVGGAIVKRMPLINIIVSWIFCPITVLVSVDCTLQMAREDTKNVEFIKKHLFLSHFSMIDPE